MNDSRRIAVWFLGAMIALPILQYVFSPTAFALLRMVRILPNTPGWWQHSAWLALGLAAAFGLSLQVVRYWRAPRLLWLVAIGGSVLMLLRLVLAMVEWAVANLAFPSLMTFQESYARFLGRTPYGSTTLYLLATFGYPAAVGLGVWLGGRKGCVRELEHAEQAPQPDAP